MTAEWTMRELDMAYERMEEMGVDFLFASVQIVPTWAFVCDHVMVVIDKPDGRHDWALMEPNTSLHDMLEIMG